MRLANKHANVQFQSTLLMRGATDGSMRKSSTFLFQSTLLMRGATAGDVFRKAASGISIHAPHARSDSLRYLRFVPVSQISIHAPHARSDAFAMT